MLRQIQVFSISLKISLKLFILLNISLATELCLAYHYSVLNDYPLQLSARQKQPREIIVKTNQNNLHNI